MGAVVETRLGRVEGFESRGLQIFRGIPFARPPVGPLRFRAPQPAEAWSGVRDATAFGPSAPQVEVQFDLMPGLGVGEQSEDCLYLNVYTPAADGARRPVMLWIHGGAFVIGSGSQGFYDMRPLALRGDLVMVSINYRLGALGFLHLADLCGESFESTANAGILDQVAALLWVRENIERFGGDPDHVTVFGESAGGMSAGTLLGTPAAAGLFRRCIPMSGAAHRFRGREEASRVAALVFERLGIELGDGEALRAADLAALLEAQVHCIQHFDRLSATRSFCPTVDGDSLPEPPIDAVRGGLARDVSLMVGCTRDEWKLFAFQDPEAATLDEAALVARIESRVPGKGADGISHGRRLVEAYRAARAGRRPTDPSELFFALETDRVFRIPAVRLAEAQCRHQPQTFAYLMCWESAMMDGRLGACHGIDVPFVTGAIGSRKAQAFAGGGPEAEALRDAMMDAWIAFARSGDPNHPGLPRWEPHEPSRRATMFFDRRCELVDAPFEAERRAWEGIL